MDVEKEIAFFDRYVADHGTSDVLSARAYERLARLFQQLIVPRAGEVCVDLGCGTGSFTRRLAAFGLRVTGIDVSSACVERARALATGETYVLGDIRWTQLPSASVDIIVYQGVLHHCSMRDSRLAVLGEGRRILRKGGRLFACDPSKHSPAMRLYRDPRSPFFSRAGKTENEVLLDRTELREELTEAGFVDVSIRGIGGMTFDRVDGRVARWFLPLYNVYEIVLASSPLERRFGTFLLTTARA